MRLALALAAMCVFPLEGRATTILAIRSNDVLVVAADSREVSVNGFESRDACKIYIAPYHIFAAAGLIENNNKTFSVFDVAKAAIAGNANHEAVVTAFDRGIVHTLPGMVSAVREQSAQFYESYVRDKQAVQSVIASNDGGELKISVVGFVPQATGAVSIERQDCPGACDVTTPAFLGIGEHEAIDGALRADGKIWSRLGIVGAINSLMATQASATPNAVGLPASIAILHRNSSEVGWNQTGFCNR
jgi:hypothetical protein